MDRLDALHEFLRQDPDDAFTRFALALELRRRGRNEEALAAFEALRLGRPDYVGTYFHLGKLYQELGRTDAAIETFEEGIRHAQAASMQRDLAELQGALLEAKGVGFDEG